MKEAEEIIADLECGGGGGVLRLAEVVSLAVRVEPELLRKARLELLPELDAGVEADLWFSSLVRLRSPASLMFDPDIRSLLRKRLGAHPTLLAEAWRVTEEVHRNISPAVLLEEKLAWHALAGRNDEVRKLLRSAVATLIRPARHGLSYWAARALPLLPEEVLEEEEAQMLAVGASLRLGLKYSSGDAWATGPVPDWVSWLSPHDIPRVLCGVQLYEDFVELSVPPQGAAHLIELPETNPLFLEVTWSEGSTRRVTMARLQHGVPTTIALSPQDITLRTALGETYRLSPGSLQAQLSRVRAPRVYITYDVEVGGAIEKSEVPFVVGVLGDFVGKPSEPLPQLRDRRFVSIDRDNFNEVLSALRPRLAFRVDSKLDDDGSRLMIDLSFASLEDFEPDRLVQQIEPLRRLVEARQRLSELLMKLDGNDRLEELLQDIVNNESARQDLGAALGLEPAGAGEE